MRYARFVPCNVPVTSLSLIPTGLVPVEIESLRILGGRQIGSNMIHIHHVPPTIVAEIEVSGRWEP